MWNQSAFTILFLRTQQRQNDTLEWKGKCRHGLTQNRTKWWALLFSFPCHPAHLSCFWQLPVGASSAVERGSCSMWGLQRIFSLVACLLPINATRSYVCVSRRQWMPFIVIQPVHKILHLHHTHTWALPSTGTFSWIVCIRCLSMAFFIKPHW